MSSKYCSYYIIFYDLGRILKLLFILMFVVILLIHKIKENLNLNNLTFHCSILIMNIKFVELILWIT